VVSPGRNDACPCGSGRKYKSCCGRLGTLSRGSKQTERQRIDRDNDREWAQLRALLEAERYRELETATRNLIERRPQIGVLWQLLGVALAKQGRDPLPALVSAAEYLPEDPVAQLNLGNALGRAGRLAEAQQSYGRALALDPQLAEAHNNLGDVQLELGCLDRAAECFRRALKVKPDFPEAHQNLGKALARLGRIEEAIASYRRALSIRSDFFEARINLAGALRSLGRLDEAIAGYRRALSLRPDFIAAHTELATALRLQRRTAESERSCRRALAIDPNSAAALSVLAELRADAGRFAEARELYERVIAIEPESPEAWAGIAHLRRMTPDDRAWLDAAQRLACRDLPPRRERVLRYAFVQYRRANELDKRCGPGHDREALTRHVDLIIRSHDPRWLLRAERCANRSPRPVFIVGMLRSGTTLAEQILASHAAVFGGGELTFWGSRSAAAITGAAARNAPEIGIEESMLARWGREYLELLEDLSPGAQRVVNKWPTNFLFLGLIHAALPQARIIHMRRNPIDTCLSIYFQHFEASNTYATDLEDIAHYYREYRRLMRHWRTVLAPGALLEVCYEDLVADPETCSRRMLEFIALPWDPRCLEFDQNTQPIVTASRWQVRQKICRASVERWRHYEKFVDSLKPLLESDLPARSA
jgi:tetratricopeptide (TPR) repeat protein